MTAKFWWGKWKIDNKMHWIPWEKFIEAKETGELGFRDLEAFNMALLSKQVWRLIPKPNLLMSQVMRSK